MKDVNAVRGRALLERKLYGALGLRKDVDRVVSLVMDEVGDSVVVMAEPGKITSVKLAERIIPMIQHVTDEAEIQRLSRASLTTPDLSTGPRVMRKIDTAAPALKQGIETEASLNKEAKELDEAITQFGFNRKDYEAINMINHVKKSDLSDEGKRARGFLPANFDSLMQNADQFEVSMDEEGLEEGEVMISDTGLIIPICPYSGSQDVYPISTNEFKCFDCEPECRGFMVDITLSDMFPG